MLTFILGKNKKTRNAILATGLIGLTTAGYIGFNRLTSNEPEEPSTVDYVLYANNPDTTLLEVFSHPVYGPAKLYSGLTEKNGFRHILAVHTEDYFINYNDKNDRTLFKKGIEGEEILKGIEEFYLHCVKVDVYNRKPRENTTYIGFTQLDSVHTLCLLAVEKKTNRILTFYPLNDITEEDLQRWNFRLD